MPRRGRAPVPTALRVLRGDPGMGGRLASEPVPASALPAAPSDMSARALQVWNRVMLDMGATGVITAVDADALRIYCETVARYEEASRLLTQTGPLVKGREGSLVKNPLAQVAKDNANIARAYAQELGLTPAARVGLRRDPGASTPSSLSTLARLRAKRGG